MSGPSLQHTKASLPFFMRGAELHASVCLQTRVQCAGNALHNNTAMQNHTRQSSLSKQTDTPSVYRQSALLGCISCVKTPKQANGQETQPSYTRSRQSSKHSIRTHHNIEQAAIRSTISLTPVYTSSIRTPSGANKSPRLEGGAGPPIVRHAAKEKMSKTRLRRKAIMQAQGRGSRVIMKMPQLTNSINRSRRHRGNPDLTCPQPRHLELLFHKRPVRFLQLLQLFPWGFRLRAYLEVGL